MAKVLIPIAEGSEELEAVTLIDILRRGGIDVTVAGLQPGPVRCARRTVILPDAALDEVLETHYDMVVLPGGTAGANHLRDDDRIVALLKRTLAEGGEAAAICAAPKVLDRAGLLKTRRFTAYPGVLPGSSGNVIEIDGPVLTSRGPGTAMDFALALVEHLTDHTNREQVEAALQRP